MQAFYVSKISVACWGMQSPPNATSLQLLVSWRNYFLSQLIWFFSPFSAPRNLLTAESTENNIIQMLSSFLEQTKNKQKKNTDFLCINIEQIKNLIKLCLTYSAPRQKQRFAQLWKDYEYLVSPN